MAQRKCSAIQTFLKTTVKQSHKYPSFQCLFMLSIKKQKIIKQTSLSLKDQYINASYEHSQVLKTTFKLQEYLLVSLLTPKGKKITEIKFKEALQEEREWVGTIIRSKGSQIWTIYFKLLF